MTGVDQAGERRAPVAVGVGVVGEVVGHVRRGDPVAVPGGVDHVLQGSIDRSRLMPRVARAGDQALGEALAELDQGLPGLLAGLVEVRPVRVEVFVDAVLDHPPRVVVHRPLGVDALGQLVVERREAVDQDVVAVAGLGAPLGIDARVGVVQVLLDRLDLLRDRGVLARGDDPISEGSGGLGVALLEVVLAQPRHAFDPHLGLVADAPEVRVDQGVEGLFGVLRRVGVHPAVDVPDDAPLEVFREHEIRGGGDADELIEEEPPRLRAGAVERLVAAHEVAGRGFGAHGGVVVGEDGVGVAAGVRGVAEVVPDLLGVGVVDADDLLEDVVEVFEEGFLPVAPGGGDDELAAEAEASGPERRPLLLVAAVVLHEAAVATHDAEPQEVLQVFAVLVVGGDQAVGRVLFEQLFDDPGRRLRGAAAEGSEVLEGDGERVAAALGLAVAVADLGEARLALEAGLGQLVEQLVEAFEGAHAFGELVEQVQPLVQGQGVGGQGVGDPLHVDLGGVLQDVAADGVEHLVLRVEGGEVRPEVARDLDAPAQRRVGDRRVEEAPHGLRGQGRGLLARLLGGPVVAALRGVEDLPHVRGREQVEVLGEQGVAGVGVVAYVVRREGGRSRCCPFRPRRCTARGSAAPARRRSASRTLAARGGGCRGPKDSRGGRCRLRGTAGPSPAGARRR